MALYEVENKNFNVNYYDEWLGVNNYATFAAESEEEAEEEFWSEFAEDQDRFTVNEIEFAYNDITLLK